MAIIGIAPLLQVSLLLAVFNASAYIVVPSHGSMEDVRPLTEMAGNGRTVNAYTVKALDTKGNQRDANVAISKVTPLFRHISGQDLVDSLRVKTALDNTHQDSLSRDTSGRLYKGGGANIMMTNQAYFPNHIFQSETLKFEQEKKNRKGVDEVFQGGQKFKSDNSCKWDPSRRLADCSNLNLDQIPTDLPKDIETLIFTGNNLTGHSLESRPFHQYGLLQFLYLDANNISYLPDYAFSGLSRLGVLSLHSNKIVMDSSFNQSRVFTPLEKSLFHLMLNNNTKNVNAPGLVYPDKALSYLSNLHTLEIDGLPSTRFGYHFQSLTKMHRLVLEGYYLGQCNISTFHNDTFKYLPTIRYLVIADCKMYKYLVQKNALAPLKQLEFLDVSYNFELGLDGLGKLLYGQRNNPKLKGIFLKYIVQRYEPCIVLYKDILENFKNLSLEYIDATHNNIEMIEYGAIQYLPTTLKHVNLTRNNIMFGAYWRHLKSMESLESLDLNGFDQAYRLPSQPPPSDIHCPPHNEGQGNSTVEKKASQQRHTDNSGSLFLQLPPNLKNLTMRSYSLAYKIDAMTFDPNNSLTFVDLHGNFLPELNGPISGLNNLEVLDVSSSYVRQISYKFHEKFTSLKRVNLYNNMLGETVAKQFTIIHSSSLEEINLGSNDIFRLSDNLFKNCTRLSTVILSQNRINTVGSALDNLPSLRRLFLTRNDISTLPETIMKHFENLKGHRFIDMTFNPIHCDCDNIDFLQWVIRTKIFGSNYTNYYCVYPNKQYKHVQMDGGYQEELKLLLSECADNTKLFICVISATIAFFLILIGVILYRFRWTMKYWYYVSKVMVTNTSRNGGIEEDFEYDLFVCYSRHDNQFITEELEVKLGQERDLNLLLQEQCFQAGQEIAESLLKAVRKSRKTLVVMSKSMLEDTWSNYQLEMARQESISTGRTVLVILFLEKIPKATMSLDMLNYIKSNVIVTYPTKDPSCREEFWDRLARDLQAS